MFVNERRDSVVSIEQLLKIRECHSIKEHAHSWTGGGGDFNYNFKIFGILCINM